MKPRLARVPARRRDAPVGLFRRPDIAGGTRPVRLALREITWQAKVVLCQGGEDGAAVGVVAKSGFAVVAPAHEMVNGAGELYAQGPGHEAMASAVARIVNC